MAGIMGDFTFRVNLVATVRVRAADETVARKVVDTVLRAPGNVEIRLANENNFHPFKGATVTSVDFIVKEDSVMLVKIGVSELFETGAVAAPARSKERRHSSARAEKAEKELMPGW
jgi:hypothetical protein